MVVKQKIRVFSRTKKKNNTEEKNNNLSKKVQIYLTIYLHKMDKGYL